MNASDLLSRRPGARRAGARSGRRTTATTRRRRRPSPRAVAVAVLVIGLLGGAWLWLRDSSLVAVRRVTVVGVTGADARQLRRALIVAARNMTTLDVNTSQLHLAVQPYSEVKALHVSTEFPHGLRIDVVEQIPVAAVTVAGRRIVVAADGTLLHDGAGSASLPEIPVAVLPGGTRVTDPSSLNAVAVLGAAPWQLLPRISRVTTEPGHGQVAQLRNGPAIYFGDIGQLAAKWQAAVAVLAEPGSAGAGYVDVSDPQRPVAGAGAASATAGSGSSAASTAAATGTATAPAATGTATAPSVTGTATAPTTTGTSTSG